MAMTLDEVLKALNTPGADTPGTEKVATDVKAHDSEKVSSAKEGLAEAIRKVEEGPSAEKVASTEKNTPASEVTKMASGLAAAEEEALSKEAGLYGSAMADGFMSRMSQYDEEISSGFSKTASIADIPAPVVEKIAEEAVRGYVETTTSLKKEASNTFNEGYTAGKNDIEKVAQDVFSAGYNSCAEVLGS